MSEYLKRANTCASECAETNHPGREHVQWAAGRFAEAREVVERVDAHIEDAKELAAVIDPEAFEGHPIERRREAAALQWAARRHIAIEHAERVLRSDWLAARTRAVNESPDMTSGATSGDSFTHATRDLPPEGAER